ncbi:hypothetical protein K466DRAFT_578400 [Polyporus arcularius HHB13444]|uniref:Uncharacterized protein n=2 Tax=Polyporaceae TaxID=5317 RepID=A0A5C3P0N6_9APHY|nr:hypothetical protein OH76DRAFT_1336795 [Polyporus brumalis]TFK81860.1 hypothetical protein K466DRAFT_578400 [Polyporus arcularius HHB13444]
MLSLPRDQSASTAAAAAASGDIKNEGFWGIITPKRTQALLARESNIAVREAEVARREAELLAGAPGGVVPATQAPVACAPCPTVFEQYTPPPVQTVIKEVVKEESLTPPGWWDQARIRAEDILDRELKIAEREREISRREEAVNRREHDASRRESWIMEQLVVLNEAQPETFEEEYIYNEPPPVIPPAGARRKPKAINAPAIVLTETAIEFATETRTVTHTQHHTVHTPVTVQQPSNTRRVASPTPNIMSSSSTTHIPKTTSVEVVVEEEVLEPEEVETTVTVMRNPRKRPPKRWFGGW